MRLLALMHQIDTISESRVQNRNNLSTGLFWKIVLGFVHVAFLLCSA